MLATHVQTILAVDDPGRAASFFQRPDRAGVLDGIPELQSAFPDFHATTEDRIVDAHSAKIVLRWTATGTHRGDLPGVPALGEVVLFRGIEILQARAGKIVARWGEWDQSGWLREPADRTA
jgi:predicted ester cyclase